MDPAPVDIGWERLVRFRVLRQHFRPGAGMHDSPGHRYM